MLYVVLRPFEGGGIHLTPGDVIDEHIFGMPYGRAEQLANQRYLRIAPEGAKHTIVPDPTLVAGANQPSDDAGFDTEKFVRAARAEFDTQPVAEPLENEIEQEQVTEDESQPESDSESAPAPAQTRTATKRTSTRKG